MPTCHWPFPQAKNSCSPPLLNGDAPSLHGSTGEIHYHVAVQDAHRLAPGVVVCPHDSMIWEVPPEYVCYNVPHVPSADLCGNALNGTGASGDSALVWRRWALAEVAPHPRDKEPWSDSHGGF